MKLNIYTYIFFLFLPLFSYAQFEGEIQMNTFNAQSNEKANISWFVKDGKHLMEIQSQYKENRMEYRFLVDENEKNAWFLSGKNDEASAYAIPYEKLQKAEFKLPLNSIVKATDDYENIAGVQCRKYTILSMDYIAECWVSKDIKITQHDFPQFMRNGDLIGLLKLNKIHGVPLKLEIKKASGELLLGQYFEKIEVKPLDNSIFDIDTTATSHNEQKK